MEWLLELWEYLGREHAQAPLSELCGWPLLPAEGGVAYALPSAGLSGSRMLDLSGASDELSECLLGAGCLRLHSGVSVDHPQLMQYVHRRSACSVLRALMVAAPAPPRGVEAAFEGVSVSARRALRAMLSVARHTEERELRANAPLIPLLRALPIYEVHGAAAAEAGAEAAAEPAAE